MLVVGLLGCAAGAALLTVARAPWATLATCLLAGAVGTLVLVAVQAGLADHHGERRAVAVGQLADLVGLRPALLVLPVALVAAAPLLRAASPVRA